MIRVRLVQLLALSLLGVAAARGGESPLDMARPFVASFCVECHSGNDADGGLRLDALAWQPADRKQFATWVRLYDRIASGEMPPVDAEQRLPYLDRRLVSMVFTISTFTGGAHPNSARLALMFDLSQGRAIKLDDVRRMRGFAHA